MKRSDLTAGARPLGLWGQVYLSRDRYGDTDTQNVFGTDLTIDEHLKTNRRGIQAGATGWRIGAIATWSDVLAARLPPAFDGLKLAAREVGGVQIQNAGTIAGNGRSGRPSTSTNQGAVCAKRKRPWARSSQQRTAIQPDSSSATVSSK